MRRTSSPRSALLGALACGLLAGGVIGCSSDEPEPEVLSASRAGGAYLEAVCPVNAAWDEADVELDRLRIALGRGAGEPVEAASFAESMEEVARASARAAERLDTERRSWPAKAVPAVESVRETLEADREQASEVAELDTGEIAAYTWTGAEEAGAAAAEAREALGLPEDPVAACAQWEAQQDGAEADVSKREPRTENDENQEHDD